MNIPSGPTGTMEMYVFIPGLMKLKKEILWSLTYGRFLLHAGGFYVQNALFEGSYRPYGSARSGRPPAFGLPGLLRTHPLPSLPAPSAGGGDALRFRWSSPSARRSSPAWTVSCPNRTIKILDELCQALSYIHSLQIIHRDLKPENILITRNGSNVKLIDFGLSDTDSYSILKHPAGTLKYASPEQQVPQTTIDNKADIYSLGVILEEIIQTTHVKLPHVHKIIRRCTSELPAQRYTSTDEIIHLLHSKNKYLPYLSVLLITILTTGGLLLGYHWGLKQNVNRYSQSTNIYNQIVQQAQHITELRCQKLYDWYDSITTQDSLSLWLKEYNNLVREVNQQVDSILKQNISPSAPEYHLYKTSLNKLTENIWIDYFYKNQNKLLTSPPALKIHNE